ncbi:MAG: hypothetical protein IME96_02625 [Proteobacteria bacterium]|nr:hypothetical protein [Pseudomonadota bacterium]
MSKVKPKFRLHLEMMVRNFYLLTLFVAIIGSVTYFSVSRIWDTMVDVQQTQIPTLLFEQDMEHSLDNIKSHVEKLGDANPMQAAMHYAAIEKIVIVLDKSVKNAINISSEGEVPPILVKLESDGAKLMRALATKDFDREDVTKILGSVRISLKSLQTFALRQIDTDFGASRAASTRARLIVIALSLFAIIVMILLGIILSKTVGKPVSSVTEKLTVNTMDIESVSDEINKDTKKQAQVAQVATKELESMIIDTIQGNISMSVEKQTEIARGFAEFLRNFVERTSTEIAMGMMSISQESGDARNKVDDLVKELATVGKNVKGQETAIGEMVKALLSIVEANREIKGKAQSSMESAGRATSKAYSGQESIASILERLLEIRSGSEGVKEIADSLANITEIIKILALNMSLKVEDIKDDTGKTYGFEAMAGKVQQLAEEVESLLGKSTAMLIPTIEGIERVTDEASQTKDLIAEVTMAIKKADDESKAIAVSIEKQASDIDKVEIEAENLRSLAQKTSETIEAQEVLAKDVDEMLRESETLIEGVNSQTGASVDGARKVSAMMEQLRQTMVNIEDGTGQLTEKSAEIAGMFNSILELANKSKVGAEKLNNVSSSVRTVSRQLTEVVKGSAA